MSPKSARLRILHISDLHERAEREKEPWRRRRVLGDAWDANLAEILQDGSIDLLCFTGDAADWGGPAEFEAAAEFLNALLARLHLPKERLFVVPGNHDVDRKIHETVWKDLREATGKVDALALARWLHDLESPPGFDPDWRKLVFARFDAYRKWVREDLGRPELVRPDKVGGPHAYRVDLDIRGAAIHVIGLDSAWLCGDRYEAGQLRVTDEQVMRHLTLGGDDLEGFRLVLMHHPLEDLADIDRGNIRRCLGDHADLLLRGHLHSPEVAAWKDPDRELRQLAAGCLYEGHEADTYPNGCQVLTVTLEEEGRAGVVEVQFRSFSPRSGRYVDDNTIYGEEGRLRISYRRRSKTVEPGDNPFTPNKAAVPPKFFGREAELLRLEASLMERHGISIVGDSRIGKTSLLRTWEQKLQESGRKVVFLDGQGSEGQSVQAFVSRILGRPAPESADAAADALDAWVRTEGKALLPIFLVDELEGIVGAFPQRFFDRLREMLDRMILAVASRLPVDELYRSHQKTSPFDNRLRIIYLGLLAESDAEKLIAIGSLKTEEKTMLREWAGRHPYHLQEFGRCLAEARLFGETRDDALERYLVMAYSRFRDLWDHSKPKEQEALRNVAKGQPSSLRSLRLRGLVTEAGLPCGEALATWLREEI